MVVPPFQFHHNLGCVFTILLIAWYYRDIDTKEYFVPCFMANISMPIGCYVHWLHFPHWLLTERWLGTRRAEFWKGNNQLIFTKTATMKCLSTDEFECRSILLFVILTASAMIPLSSVLCVRTVWISDGSQDVWGRNGFCAVVPR